MTDKELKRLSRAELLEMLIAQTQEVERLQLLLEDAQRQLDDRQILLNKAGSIADACIQINGVFEAAQAAAEEYLVNIRLRSQRQEEVAEHMEADAIARAEGIVAEAEAKSKALEVETAEKCDAMVAKAKAESDAYWKNVSVKVDAYLKQHAELRNMLYLELISNGEEE